MTGRITVVAANLHNERAAVAWLGKRSRRDAPGHYDVALVSEASRRRRQLRRLPGHDYHTGTIPGPSQETGILLSRSFRNLGHGAYFLSPATPPGAWEKIGQERWGQELVTDVDGARVAIINAHPVPGRYALRSNDPDHPLVTRYTDALDWVARTVQKHRRMGHRVIVGGDWQMREHEHTPWSPRTMFDRLGMGWFWHGIDLIAWGNGVMPVGNPATRVVDDFPSDHPALRVTLTVTR